MTLKTKILLTCIETIASPLVLLAALVMKFIRYKGVNRLPLCKKILLTIGVFPINDNYYEPLFNSNQIKRPLSDDRNLPGIDWNRSGQLEILGKFSYNSEIMDLPVITRESRRERKKRKQDLAFYINNGSFGPGDAEYLYNIIRLVKPKKIIEIGSGSSTLMAMKALQANNRELAGFTCKHICIEPYEMPWLEKTSVTVIRKKVEDVEKSLFLELSENDILFIDSSHMIRPQGDVILEYLELLPLLNKGVIVHIHDIFSPKDYPASWVKDEVKFWNEQYLLEAFLSSNNEWEIIGALNYLHHNSYDKLKATCGYLTPQHEPGSFYIRKIL